jgi:hypothetical protein
MICSVCGEYVDSPDANHNVHCLGVRLTEEDTDEYTRFSYSQVSHTIRTFIAGGFAVLFLTLSLSMPALARGSHTGSRGYHTISRSTHTHGNAHLIQPRHGYNGRRGH